MDDDTTAADRDDRTGGPGASSTDRGEWDDERPVDDQDRSVEPPAASVDEKDADGGEDGDSPAQEDEAWDPPRVARATNDDAQAVSTGFPDMDEVIEPGSIDAENAAFVVLGIVGSIGLLFYVLSILP